MAWYGRKRNSGSRYRRRVVNRTRAPRRKLNVVGAAAGMAGRAFKRAKAYRDDVNKNSKRRRFVKAVGYDPHSGVHAGTNLTYRRFKSGKKPRVMSQLMKLERRAISREVQRFGAVNPLYNVDGSEPGGAYRMSYEGNASGASTSYVCPLYVLQIGRNQGGQTDKTFLRLRLNKTLGGASWEGMTGNYNDGGTGTTSGWTVCKSSGGSAVAQIAKVAILDWVKLQFTIRSPTSRSGYFRVQLVQFPDLIYPNSTSQEASSFWTKYMKPLVYNPASTMVSSQIYPKEMRVLKTWVQKFEADDHGDKDATGDRHKLAIFHRFNRVCDFRKRGGTMIPAVGLNDDNAGAETVSVDQTRSFPVPDRARLFFIVSCTTFDPPSEQLLGANDHGKWVTFDMEARCGWITKTDLAV